jgi:hypothetical protein
VHILVVTDADLFYMLDQVADGWEIARRAPVVAGGGATVVLDRMDREQYADELSRLKECGWDLHHVHTQEELIEFGRRFARTHYEGQR